MRACVGEAGVAKFNQTAVHDVLRVIKYCFMCNCVDTSSLCIAKIKVITFRSRPVATDRMMRAEAATVKRSMGEHKTEVCSIGNVVMGNVNRRSGVLG